MFQPGKKKKIMHYYFTNKNRLLTCPIYLMCKTGISFDGYTTDRLNMIFTDFKVKESHKWLVFYFKLNNSTAKRNLRGEKPRSICFAPLSVLQKSVCIKETEKAGQRLRCPSCHCTQNIEQKYYEGNKLRQEESKVLTH